MERSASLSETSGDAQTIEPIQSERQYKKFGNMIKSKKMRRAKELEDINDYDFN